MMDPVERVRNHVGLQWDAGNERKNWDRHRVGHDECEQAIRNPRVVIRPDEMHSQSEERFQLFGQTDRGRLLLIAFTFRGQSIRVISAGDMSRREREEYRRATEEVQADSEV